MTLPREGLAVEVRRDCAWCAPLAVAAGLVTRDRTCDGTLCLLSDPVQPSSRSFVATAPDWVRVVDRVDGPLFDSLRTDASEAGGLLHGVVGLAAYDAGARPATGKRPQVWPDLILARYSSLLVFDHETQTVEAVGRGADAAGAEAACHRAEAWLVGAVEPQIHGAPSCAPQPEASPDLYRAAVAEVVARIRAGELFQANIAQGWTGQLKPDADPFDVFVRLTAGGGSAFGAFWQIGDRALVSNSPELFLTWDPAEAGGNGSCGNGGRVETRPIKGTRPRRSDPLADTAEAEALLSSAKDRAENLMIVDLMRNDLARVCVPGSVVVERLFEVERLPTVHHLVSTVTGVLNPGLGAADLLEATFPPGSITGAPKHQAMKVIAELEPPRGAWCGSLFLLDDAGGLTGSVLIRTATFEWVPGEQLSGRWNWRALAGAGIVADSDPQAELDETEVKFSALRRALIG